jgi:chemotaxis protein CheX
MNEQIWASMLGLTLSSVEYADALAHGGGFIGGCVQLVGAWQGAVRVDCTPILARMATTTFQGRKAEELSLDEVRDTVGELANMVAGSVKALLPQPTHISLPSVADGNDYDLTVRHGRVLLQCPFECEGERLIVSLIERDVEQEFRPGRSFTQAAQ